MDTPFLITSFVTLFVIVDPIGLTPLFAAMTQDMKIKLQRQIATRAIIVAFFILVAFALFGDAILSFAGISMPAFRIAGGILLFITALDMLFERRTKRREGQKDEELRDDPSVFPLAIPLIAGPGSIATVILLAGNTNVENSLIWTFGVIAAVLSSVFAMFLTAPLIQRALGKTGINVTTRLLGMLLAALAVQFVMDGIADFGLRS
ncbi:MAG: MarC family protein [Rhodobacteraceae bacterium]|jgi:multiple antibiotic resistance protein|nr:MarC family protein [Paracoccaceae bacterium]